MFEQVRDTLSAAIDELAVPVDAAALAESLGLLDRLTAKVLDGVGAFDQAEGWRDAGALGMTSWLRTTGCSKKQANNLARTAKRLAGLPVTAAAYRDGTLSTGQVQAIIANLNDQVAPLFAQAEAGLVPTLAAMPVRDVSTAMQAWAQAARDSLSDPADPEPAARRRSLHLSRTLDGRRELSGSLDPEAGLLAETALRVAQTDDLDGEPERSLAHRRADGLVDIFQFFLDHQQSTPPGTRHRPHLNVFLDYHDLVHAAQAADTAAIGADATGADGPVATHAASATATGWLPDGTVLDAATILRLACDAGVNRVITKGRSTILDYGTTTRIVPPTSSKPSSPATGTAASVTATSPPIAATPTTYGTGPTAAPPTSTASSWPVAVTTTCSTNPAGTPSSSPTAPSSPPHPTGPPSKADHPANHPTSSTPTDQGTA